MKFDFTINLFVLYFWVGNMEKLNDILSFVEIEEAYNNDDLFIL